MAIASIKAKSTNNLPKDSGFSVIAAAAEAAAVPKPMPAPIADKPIANPAPRAIIPDSASALMESPTSGFKPIATANLTTAANPITRISACITMKIFLYTDKRRISVTS